MKSGGWQTDSGDGGFNIYQRYTAGNCNYKLSFHNSCAEIIKVTPAAEEVLGTSRGLMQRQARIMKLRLKPSVIQTDRLRLTAIVTESLS